jgi:hypothetical protein
MLVAKSARAQKRLSVFQEVEHKRFCDDMFVDLTIYDVPARLLREFGEKVVHSSHPAESTKQ